MGTALVMGRKTYESFGAKPLPGRDNIVVTRSPDAYRAAHPEAIVVGSLDEALATAVARGARSASVIGGSEIYAAALPVADEMLLTYVDHPGGGDVFFPPWDASEWEEMSREPLGAATLVRYVRHGRAMSSAREL
jgi:dihydrofolate reductase